MSLMNQIGFAGCIEGGFSVDAVADVRYFRSPGPFNALTAATNWLLSDEPGRKTVSARTSPP